MTQKTYDRLLELGVMLAKAEYTIILDGKYDRSVKRQAVITQARTRNIPLKIVYCTTPESVLRDCLNQRQHDVSDATADLIDRQLANAEDFTTAEQAYVVTVDTSQDRWQEKLSDII